jgi:hypothetical protein
MRIIYKTLIAVSVLATLSATCAYAQPIDLTGSWNSSSSPQASSWNAPNSSQGGSQIVNGQTTLNTQWSNIGGNVEAVGGDAAIQGAAAGNLVDIMTMNNTNVLNNQIVGSNAAIGSDVNTNFNNIMGSVGIQNQVVCNGASVSTDPVYTQVSSNQVCHASDPASAINTSVTNIGGDLAIQSSSMANSFESDSNASNFPVRNNQLNSSMVSSTINANTYNVQGSMSLSGSAIGNTAQILHYSTN